MTDDTTENDVSLARRIPWRRLANIVGLVLVLAVVVPFVVYAVPQVVGAEHSYVVLSGSMQPVMSPGDAIIVNDVPASEVETGDVISFTQGNAERPTTHRVIEVVEQNGGPAFRTEGDANENADQSLVTPADLEGKVMSVGGYLFVIPLIGHVILFASTTEGLIALLIVPLSLLVISEIWGIITAATSGGSESAAAGEDDDGGDGDDGDDETAVAADTTNGDGDRSEDHETVLEPDTDSEAATIEELAKRVEERPDAADASATDDVDTAAAAIEGKEPGTPETADEEDGSEKEESGEAASEEPEGLVFSAAELQLGLVVLFAFFAYSAWVAYATFFQVWAFAVAASTGAALLLLAGLYVVGGEAEPADQETEDEQQQTVDDDGSAPGTDEESLFAASEDPVAETESEATTTTAEPDTDTVHGSPEVDIDELLSLGEASEVDAKHSALDLNGAEGASDADEEGTTPETSEVGDDD